ncbi:MULTISPECIES: hypothetical protein [Mesorhizobium]|uniref:hypothetical protein n=1 Tax=Mesorhizobium TaxID=68287 RepID=UPI0013DF8996|nr:MULTISPECIES: hypothetical protein [Mesorhizobium]WIE92743.1 hypothetical protein P9270_006160 [Mesorhizobium sp. WSM4875]MBE1711634.1 hypothetical protein [Mesorhizobium japonicum]MBE1717858.1 hypothetical protein [Mesorhizobium japonicum]MBZ9798563.1 hypothetical protein [Mesorhizobium sp. ES1-4]MDF3211881.1 hypothetical protein [Mesorhizobium sp. LMG15046]
MLGKLVSLGQKNHADDLELGSESARLRILAGEAADAGGTVPAPRNSMFALM